MAHPLVVNITRTKFDVYCGRGPSGKCEFGNDWAWYEKTTAPYKCIDRDDSIKQHAIYFVNRFINDLEFRLKIMGLKGKKLGCFCAPLKCHCDIIATFANMTSNEWFILETKADNFEWYSEVVWKRNIRMEPNKVLWT